MRELYDEERSAAERREQRKGKERARTDMTMRQREKSVWRRKTEDEGTENDPPPSIQTADELSPWIICKYIILILYTTRFISFLFSFQLLRLLLYLTAHVSVVSVWSVNFGRDRTHGSEPIALSPLF